ncbi:MAG: type II toxin-antitoxin system MqsR family toxin [Lachnospiraceae bacterium]|nr:type II toxin-antitoxin system MqsR family toxin [Lachnospiraceae bacterium]
MNTRATTSDIEAFLAKVRDLLSAGRYDFVPRRKNLLALEQHGFTIADAKDEIKGLTVEDYYKGPKTDFDSKRPGDIWEFKKLVNERQFYVKIKIVEGDGEAVLKCIGFHEDEFA